MKAVDLHDTYLKDNIEICVHLCALKFEKLQKLDISETDAEDSCLQVLGMHCKDLRYINNLNILIKEFFCFNINSHQCDN